ncbi:hypothetical protein CDAR_16181 [Caerostris darwini]|uniref:CHCH domain-containing protein n=1 Tax=Caerostris darwini TaxID=1538125 RepID=A0AAV4QQD7_9ARAC|nr:hypothetical protein CDAR_16181 [Caerostris darwini]
MASHSSSQTRPNAEDNSLDAMDKFINESGCADFHFKLQECFADTKDWRKCQKEVRDFRNCVNETNMKNKSSVR